MSEEFEEKKKEAFIKLLEEASETDLSEIICETHKRPLSECDNIVCEILSSTPSEDYQDFDLYARDIEDYKWLKEFVPSLIIYSAGGIVPFQAEGFVNDLHFYYRERGGVASLRVAENKNDCYAPVTNALYVSNVEVEEFRSGNGWISTLLTLIEKLEKNPYLYRFQSDEIDWGEDGNATSGLKNKFDEFGNVVRSKHGQVGWGFTVDEAYENAYENLNVNQRAKFCDFNLWDDMKGENLKAWEKAEARKWSHEKFDEYVRLVNLQKVVVEVEGNDRVYPQLEPVFEVRVPESWRNEEGNIEIPFED